MKSIPYLKFLTANLCTLLLLVFALISHYSLTGLIVYLVGAGMLFLGTLGDSKNVRYGVANKTGFYLFIACIILIGIRLPDMIPALRFDAMLSDYLLQSNRPVENYETLCRAWLKTEKASPAHLFALYPRMERAIEENGLASLEHDVELPLLNVLYGMEEIGFMTDEAVLSELHTRFSEAAGMLEARIYDAAGERFNILSTKQLGRILFEKLGLPSGFSALSHELDPLPFHLFT